MSADQLSRLADPDGLYELLGVEPDVSAKDLRTGFRRAAMRWHPDRCSDPDAPAQIQRVYAAADILLNDLLRKAYDARAQRLIDELSIQTVSPHQTAGPPPPGDSECVAQPPEETRPAEPPAESPAEPVTTSPSPDHSGPPVEPWPLQFTIACWLGAVAVLVAVPTMALMGSGGLPSLPGGAWASGAMLVGVVAAGLLSSGFRRGLGWVQLLTVSALSPGLFILASAAVVAGIAALGVLAGVVAGLADWLRSAVVDGLVGNR